MAEKHDEAHNEQNPESYHEPVEHDVVAETWYDDEDPQASEPWEEESESMSDKVFNCVVGSVPIEVVEHLNNGRKEFVKAGIALAEDRLKKADDFMDKARKAHANK